jgi:hypothetical protein
MLPSQAVDLNFPMSYQFFLKTNFEIEEFWILSFEIDLFTKEETELSWTNIKKYKVIL